MRGERRRRVISGSKLLMRNGLFDDLQLRGGALPGSCGSWDNRVSGCIYEAQTIDDTCAGRSGTSTRTGAGDSRNAARGAGYDGCESVDDRNFSSVLDVAARNRRKGRRSFRFESEISKFDRYLLGCAESE